MSPERDKPPGGGGPSPESESVERLLAEVIGGERSVDDPLVKQLLERRPDLQEKVDSLRDLGAMLAGLGEGQREELAEARSAPAPGEERAAAAARAELAGSADRSFRPSNVHRFLWPALAVAAAVIVGLVWVWDGSNPESGQRSGDPGETLLLSSSVQLDGALPRDGDVCRLEDGLLVSVEDAPVARLGELTVRLLDGAGKVELWSGTMTGPVKTFLPAELRPMVRDYEAIVVEISGMIEVVHEAVLALER